MMLTKEATKQKIAELVAKYQSLTPSAIKSYNEAKTKQGFIQPLFQYLGWDFLNTDEVSPEEKASKGRVDYAFKLRGVSQFYVEAKPLKADLNAIKFIEQTITYAYNKGVTWAVLTDFEDLRLFNAQTGNPFLNLSCQDYLQDFDKLWLLSKESLESGALNREAAKFGALTPSQPVEKRLYAQLRQWRGELYNQLLAHNPHLTYLQIDEIIQRLFNRLIFIRTAEDRGIEEKILLATINQWKSSGHKGELVESIREVFRQFDGYYDSDLFMLHPVDQAYIEGDTVERIIRGLYEIPKSFASYDFSVIDADVLGAVYEQYLGYVATIKSIVKERAKAQQARLELGIPGEETISLEAKKRKRKGEGIYYTPQWVVNYIVRETVGRFIKEHSHDEIVKLKILDPACGSGSFLIRAYDELLRYHAGVKSKELEELDQWDRRPILMGNIYGVDLDNQAVEIARLNLLIRALAKRETLPSLAGNVCQGNSLISGSEEELKKYFGDAWQEKQPFNWQEKFPEIMKGGGFDVVIGNPPYVGFQGFKEKDYLREVYETAKGRFDIYIPFIELGLRVLKPGGLLSFICPTNFMKRGHGEVLRKYLKAQTSIIEIVDFRDIQVFEEALNYTGIFVFKKIAPIAKHKLIYKPESISAPHQEFEQAGLDNELWVFPSLAALKVITAIKQKPVESLETLALGISEGIVTGKNDVFVIPLIDVQKLGLLEEEISIPILQGKDIRRYFIESPKHAVIYPYTSDSGKSVVLEEKEIQSYPGVWNYLQSRQKQLSGRKYLEGSEKHWYELWNQRSFDSQANEKIVVAEIAETNRFALCPASIFYLDTVCGVTLKGDLQARYVLGILNSRLMEFYYKNITVPKANKFYIYKTMYLKRLPIRLIDFNNPNEKKLHDDLVTLVDRMLALHKSLAAVSEYESEKRQEIEREIKQTDEKIENLVYALYGLSEEERRLVESETQRK